MRPIRYIASSVVCLVTMVYPGLHAQTLSIMSVEILVSQGNKTTPQQVSGKLYRVDPETNQRVRPYAAKVETTGALSPPVSCRAGDSFESDADHPFAYAIPKEARATCSPTLKFGYLAMNIAWGPFEAPKPGSEADLQARLSIYSSLVQAAARNGDLNSAIAASDAKVSTVAKLLGDSDLSSYVLRDPSQGDRLILNSTGIDALKDFQTARGLAPTGTVDANTEQFLRYQSSGPNKPSVNCSRGVNGAYTCALK